MIQANMPACLLESQIKVKNFLSTFTLLEKRYDLRYMIQCRYRQRDRAIWAMENLAGGNCMQERKRCRYYEWDKESFLLPADLMLSDRSELADALRVFYCAGGYDFFCVSEPKLYASRWLMFLGELYELSLIHI